MPKVTFVNEMVTVEAREGESLLDVAERNGINVFRGLFQGFHCGRMKGWCGRCKVWATPLAEGAVNEKTSAERRGFRINGALPRKGTMRLACQVEVRGDVEVRTRTGWVIPQSTRWEPDPRKSKWKDRWEHRNDEPAEDEKPKKAAGAAAGAAAKKAGAAAAKKADAPAPAADAATAGSAGAPAGGTSEAKAPVAESKALESKASVAESKALESKAPAAEAKAPESKASVAEAKAPESKASVAEAKAPATESKTPAVGEAG